ncbi:MAG: DNA polymerase III subunit gamma/tau [Anaerolineaceae bacterium]|nr:DNA polymerase III subunit gamma/tau [Anaerolineaceae bacterium]
MPELALYLKWRPQRFDEVIGQSHITQVLANSLKAGRFRHAYLFSGPRGTGKTTTARLLAKAVNCEGDDRPCGECSVCRAIQEGRYLDLIEMDAATHTGVDDVRELREKIVFAPSEGRYKVYIIDEVHRFTGNAFDALLKTLEEPPNHAVFVLATTEVGRVPATIQSRCLHFSFRRIPQQDVFTQLAQIAQDEGYRVEEDALQLIARAGNGSVRDSISLLDQLLTDPAEMLTREFVQTVIGTEHQQVIASIVAAMSRSDLVAGFKGIQEALEHGADARQLCQQMVEQLRLELLNATGANVTDAATNSGKRWPKRRLIAAIAHFSQAANQMRRSWQPQLDLELAFLKSVEWEETEIRHAPASSSERASRRTAEETRPEVARTNEVERGVNQVGRPALTVEHIQDRWPELLEITRQSPANVTQLLRQVEQMDVVQDTLRLFTKPLFLEKWQDAAKKNALERGVQQLFGERVSVEFLDSTANGERAKANGNEVNPLQDLIPVAKELGAEVIEPGRETE